MIILFALFVRFHCVLKQACHSHCAHTTWNRRDGFTFLAHFVELDVAANTVAVWLSYVWNAVDADVDDGGFLLDVIGGDHLRLTDGYDEDVGATAYTFEILGAAVANRYGCVGISA